MKLRATPGPRDYNNRGRNHKIETVFLRSNDTTPFKI
jgi:hypothetical protein